MRPMPINGPDGRVFLFYRGPGHTPQDVAEAARRRFFPHLSSEQIEVRDARANTLHPVAHEQVGRLWERAGAVQVRPYTKREWRTQQ